MTEGMVRTMKIKKERMKTGTGLGFMCATELADTIVRTTGIPFRTAHHIVGKSAKSEKSPNLSDLDKLSLKILGEKLSDRGLSEKAIKDALDPMKTINKRRIPGGPAPEETKRQVTVLKKELGSIKDDNESIRKKINSAAERLDKACQNYF
jgi:argininosuccinate lyase